MLARLAQVSALVLSVSALGACRSTGGSFLIFGGSGAPQADLVECVQKAERELAEAREDFSVAFQFYQRVTSPQAVELEELSDDFADSIEDCEDRGADLAERLEGVRKESQKLVQGWNDELPHFSGDALRKKSETQLRDTEARAQRVLAGLERVQERMQPVLLKLQDYALFFHHNLNARAIATLEDTYKDFDGEFHALESEFAKADGETRSFLTNFVEPAPAKPEKKTEK